MTRTKALTLATLAAVAALAGCAKKEAPAAAAAADDEAPPTASAQELPAPPPPPMTEAQTSAKLLDYIDTRPECQQYRKPFEASAAAPEGTPPPADLAQVFKDANAAGCTKHAGN